MILKLNHDMAKLLMEEVEDARSLIKSQKVVDDMSKLEVSDIRELQLLINDEIVYRGLDKQETVNSIGKKLYALYDEILHQKHGH